MRLNCIIFSNFLQADGITSLKKIFNYSKTERPCGTPIRPLFRKFSLRPPPLRLENGFKISRNDSVIGILARNYNNIQGIIRFNNDISFRTVINRVQNVLRPTLSVLYTDKRMIFGPYLSYLSAILSYQCWSGKMLFRLVIKFLSTGLSWWGGSVVLHFFNVETEIS